MQDINRHKVMASLLKGFGIMAFFSLPINSFNQGSIVSSRYRLGILDTIKAIYSGDLYKKAGSPKKSIFNFAYGIGGHWMKEVPRLTFKPFGLTLYKPWLDEKFEPQTANTLFAAGLAACEILINPADTYRVKKQAGQVLEMSLRRLYAGALLNGSRQFLTWWTWGVADIWMNKGLTQMNIDPESDRAIIYKAYPGSLAFTMWAYPVEQIKNYRQYEEIKLNKQGVSFLSQLVATFNSVKSQDGWRGFYRGMFFKSIGNSMLVLGTLVLIREGKRQLNSDVGIQNRR